MGTQNLLQTTFLVSLGLQIIQVLQEQISNVVGRFQMQRQDSPRAMLKAVHKGFPVRLRTPAIMKGRLDPLMR